jgi:hypothetical protein
MLEETLHNSVLTGETFLGAIVAKSENIFVPFVLATLGSGLKIEIIPRFSLSCPEKMEELSED